MLFYSWDVSITVKNVESWYWLATYEVWQRNNETDAVILIKKTCDSVSFPFNIFLFYNITAFGLQLIKAVQ